MYVAAILGFAAILCALVAVANFVTDPLHRFGLDGDERVLKPWIVTHVPHQGIIIGSSKTDYANPRDIPEVNLVNVSFSAALPEEIGEFIRRYVRPGQIVFLGLDLYMFNQRENPIVSGTIVGPGDRPSLSVLVDRAKYLFSFDVLQTALDRLVSNDGARPSPYLENGARYVPLVAETDDWRGNSNRILQNLRRGHYHDFAYSETRVHELESIRAFADKHDICLRVFINPLNRSVADLLDSLPARAAFQRFRKDMNRVFPDLIDFTALSYDAPSMYFRSDPFHYLPSTGAKMIHHVLEQAMPSPSCAAWSREASEPGADKAGGHAASRSDR